MRCLWLVYSLYECTLKSISSENEWSGRFCIKCWKIFNEIEVKVLMNVSWYACRLFIWNILSTKSTSVMSIEFENYWIITAPKLFQTHVIWHQQQQQQKNLFIHKSTTVVLASFGTILIYFPSYKTRHEIHTLSSNSIECIIEAKLLTSFIQNLCTMSGTYPNWTVEKFFVQFQWMLMLRINF